MNADAAAAFSLLNAAAVRRRAERMLALGLADKLPHFRIDLSRLDATADLVAATTRRNYPSLDVPIHSRWRHFDRQLNGAPGGLDLQTIADAGARARVAFDLVIISVLLDAGAGARWRYRDPVSGNSYSRSEGLAIASLRMFENGDFSVAGNSGAAHERHRADATALANFDAVALRRGFQVDKDNPLVGLDGRAELLRALGRLALSRPDVFARNDPPRPGGFYDHLAAKAERGGIAAPLILSELLKEFGPIWPSRLTLGGVPLGDCWRHPSITTEDATNELVPLHKLSQWLAYSLIEPLAQSGLAVTDIDGLTGLAEYRNGGLFVDCGVLLLRDAAAAARPHEVGSPLVVEWRALTVALLDRLAGAVRTKLGLDAGALPLGKVLQGGSWAAGRELAFARRPDGSPPINVISDGTVF